MTAHVHMIIVLQPSPSAIIERIPTKRAAARIATLEPPEQAAAVEHVAARAAALAGQLAVGAHDAVADGALGLALERGGHVAPPGYEAVDQGALVPAAAEVDHPLRRHEPAAPLLLVDGDAVDGVDGGARERV